MRRLAMVISAAALALASSAALAQPAEPTAPIGRDGMTVELGLGLGFLRVSPDEGGNDTELGPLGGPNVGIGGFINPQLAITGRLAGVSWFESEAGVSVRVTSYFLGPSVQYWPTENLWFGGGLGLGISQISVSVMGQSDSDEETDVSLDLRGGFTLPTTTRNSFNVSVELTPVFHDGGSITGMAILAGYQYL